MKKPRTKLEFLTVNVIRKLPLEKITLELIKPLNLEDDYKVLVTIEDIFNNRLTSDVKSFILAILRIPIKELDNLTK